MVPKRNRRLATPLSPDSIADGSSEDDGNEVVGAIITGPLGMLVQRAFKSAFTAVENEKRARQAARKRPAPSKAGKKPMAKPKQPGRRKSPDAG